MKTPPQDNTSSIKREAQRLRAIFFPDSEDSASEDSTTSVPIEELDSLASLSEPPDVSASSYPQAVTIDHRYILLRMISKGGIGSIFVAYDPRLKREVAIKLLRLDVLQSPRAAEEYIRLQREAQALAKVAHPHIVSVFDTGVFQGTPYIAMEYVRGSNLKDWLASERTLSQILDAFFQAGQGLLAAHSAGLIHRDFKAANVLLREDGTFCVADFGLVRDLSSAETSSVLDPSHLQTLPLDEESALLSLTQTGQIMGTPAYMAPEQLLGRQVDHRSDQFNFCASLYEAIYAEKPFVGQTLLERTKETRVAFPNRSKRGFPVPKQLRQLLLRGLSQNREDRHPSMEPILEEMARSFQKKTTHWFLAAFVFLLVGFGVFGVRMSLREAPENPCFRGSQRIGKNWNPPVKKQIESAFLRTNLPYSKNTWHLVRNKLDSYERTWRRTFFQTCETTRAATDNKKQETFAITHCLNERASQFTSLLELLKHIGPAQIRDAVPQIFRLESPLICRGQKPSLLPPIRSSKKASLESLFQQFAKLSLLYDELRVHRSFPHEFQKIKENEVFALSFLPASAVYLWWKARFLAVQGKYKESHDLAYQALWAAIEIDDIRLQVQIYLDLSTLLRKLHQIEQIPIVLGYLFALDRRIPLEPRLRFRARLKHVVYLFHREDYQKSLSIFLKAFAAANRELPPNDPILAASYITQGALFRRVDRYEDALRSYEKGLLKLQQALGSKHPLVAVFLNNAANIHNAFQQHQKAYRMQKQALELLSNDPSYNDHAFVLQVFHNIATSANYLKQWTQAQAYLEQSKRYIPPKGHVLYVASMYSFLTISFFVAMSMKNFQKAYEEMLALENIGARAAELTEGKRASIISRLGIALFFLNKTQAAQEKLLQAEERFEKKASHHLASRCENVLVLLRTLRANQAPQATLERYERLFQSLFHKLPPVGKKTLNWRH